MIFHVAINFVQLTMSEVSKRKSYFLLRLLTRLEVDLQAVQQCVQRPQDPDLDNDIIRDQSRKVLRWYYLPTPASVCGFGSEDCTCSNSLKMLSNLPGGIPQPESATRISTAVWLAFRKPSGSPNVVHETVIEPSEVYLTDARQID